MNEKIYEPPYFEMMRRLNREGPPLLYSLPHLSAYSARELRSLLDGKAQIIDIRSPTSFAGGHIWDAQYLADGLPILHGLLPELTTTRSSSSTTSTWTWTAWSATVRLGYDNIAGYLADGFAAWFKEAKRSSGTGTWSPSDLAEHLDDPSVYILDVRKIGQREEKGYIQGSHHIYVGHPRSTFRRSRG